MNRVHIKRVITHYFKMSWEDSGLGWDSDNDAEIFEVIDELIELIKKETIQDIAEDSQGEITSTWHTYSQQNKGEINK